jgi:hypothetical protein
MFAKVTLLPLLFFVNATVLAANFFYCPRTLSYVYPGDTIEQVKGLCGKPVSEETKQIRPQEEREVLQYVYNFQPHAEERVYKPQALVVNMLDEQIVQIQVEGSSVQETDYCSVRRKLKIGDSRRWVIYACEEPSVIQKVMQTVIKNRVEQTILTYQESEYTPLVKLYFHDGKLVKIE